MSVPLKNPRCPGCDKFLFKKRGQKKKLKLKMKQRFFLPNFNERLLLMISCVQNAEFFNIKRRIDVDFSIFGNDQSQSTSDDSSINIRLKPEVQESNIERIEVPIQRTISTHKYCCFCSITTNLSVIPEDARMQSYIETKI